MFGDRMLSSSARRAISDDQNEVFVSAASVWEITTKHRIGKLNHATAVATDVASAVAAQGFGTLGITLKHAQEAGSLPGVHRDPFDRMLVAQSVLERMRLVSNDSRLDAFPIKRLW